MSAQIDTISTARTLDEECNSLRENLALLIRSRTSLTAEECAWFKQHGLNFDSDSNEVRWTPPPGVSGDLKTERGSLLNAYDLLTGPTQPITAEELAEAIARGDTFGDMLAELGVFEPNGGEGHKQ